jgi:glycosyltransferase involved in cell wall biosynthesis
MDQSKALAIITNSCPPYRTHVHRRIVDEMPEIKLFSVFTHEVSSSAWAFEPASEIAPVMFGQNESTDTQGRLSQAAHEWRKGGRIIRWMRANRVRAAVVAGYNDLGRLRILRWCHRQRIPCLLHADSNILDDTRTGWRAWIKRRFLGKVLPWCDTVLVCGRLGKEYFLKYGVDPERIFFYPYEPDYNLIQNLSPQTVQDAKHRFGLSSERRSIVYSGRLISIKRVDLLIDAFSAIADQRPEWDLLIIGDGPLRQTLEQRLPAQLKNRCIWTGFIDDQSLVSALYRAADVLVLPSEREPWALVINEAAAAGLAIVASHVVGAAAELVRDNVNGKIFRSGDLQHLIQCLMDVTRADKIDAYKSASISLLQEWRDRCDPIQGLRRALQFTGVL